MVTKMAGSKVKKRHLPTAKTRLEWARKLSREIITQDERTRDKEKATNNYVEANYPGQLIEQGAFSIGYLKRRENINHHVAGGYFCSVGVANVYDDKPTKLPPDVGENHLAKKVAPGKRESILTDCGAEYPAWHEEVIPNHEFERTCNRLGIKHSTTKVKPPWTNGCVERLKKPL
jgi:hypothetical protein